ncbi:MAG: DUF433 domain-containing protein [Actinomyces urogenitalis]|uniref:DUF433 domain-containing protein n=1 Tax=Actinomyces urogenitalis TaxID=103621 RepID=UPI000661673E|nr:DUF433 domain-containing protein [Actinomyces urogenitalis]MBS6071726.1 DUF433 domain-containing protein [Actinomyces urogenitalis]MDU0864605.1 DUF433 domain-containing protein [Actinomyces urogenitalis]MDU0875151.1 DUF433 domain-containing protein [Actinomyces urogenitalis]MDU1564602.1 DUF433 domain-containing protein [Actinomyces urogenitalis]MDU1640167.1 DUF433 domain-containing protein [Actinomyces urogenitalis]
MAFPLNLTSVLTGVTPAQLHTWRAKGLIVPEVRPKRPPLYSMRDLIALRSIAKLRNEVSLQKISKAFANLNVLDMMDHPSAYRFGTDGTTIFVEGPDQDVYDLVVHPGQRDMFTFEELTGTFLNFRGDTVVDFRRPERYLEVEPARMGGWPTIAGTRVPYDTVAQVIDGHEITVENIGDYYPGVSAEAALDAVAFDQKVRAVA